MKSEFRHLGNIELGHLTARLVCDVQGRKCIAITIEEKEHLFTVAQALLIREIFDLSLQALATHNIPNEPGDTVEESK